MLFAMAIVGVAHSAEKTDLKAEEITLALKPLTIVDYSLGPSEEFNVNVTALNVSSLHGFQLGLGYDSAVIECSGV